MSDLLEHGTPQRRRPRWVPAVLALLVVAAGATYVATGHGGPLDSPPEPSATPRPVGTPTPAAPAASQLPAWPELAGACGNRVFVPVLSTTPLRERTGLRVLVGGHGLRRVDVDTGATWWVRGADVRRRQVTSLARVPGRTYAVGARCSTTSSTGQVLQVAGGAARVVAPRADLLLAGAGQAWRFWYPADPRRHVVLRPLDGSARTPLPRDFAPMAVSSRYFVGGFYANLLPDDLPQVALLERAAPGRLRTLGQGTPLAVTRDAVVSSGSCALGSPCALRVLPLAGGPSERFELPDRRRPTSDGVVSADGRRVAFLAARSEPDTRYRTDHPGGPSDLLVLDLGRRRVDLVPGIELAPKSGAGLAWSADGGYLLVAVNAGPRTRLLVWRPGWDRPRESPARLPGPVQYVAPVLVIDTTDARAAAEFWRQLLGLVYREGHEPPGAGVDDPAGRDWLNLRAGDGTPVIAFQQVDELARSTWPEPGVPQQLHLDLSVGSSAELEAVHARVLALGGTLRFDRFDDPEEPLRVYADPDGHPFCVFVAGD